MRTARSRTAALLAAASAVAVLAGCGTEEEPEATDGTPPDASSSAPASEPPSTEPATDSATPSTDTSEPAGVAVPVYFVGDTPIGPRLFREFRTVAADNPVDEALALLAAGDTLDPDYRTLLPGGSLTLVQGDHSEAIGVNVPVEYADRPAGMSAKEAKLAVQQVVYTVQGALQSRAPVEFFSDGLTPVLGFDQSTFKAAGQNGVLALVNVTEPAEGATVSGTITASGVANSFESTVPWQVLDGSGAVVEEGFATAEGWGDKLYPWQAPVDLTGLAPGSYTFVATTDDASDGEGGGPTKDTKTITVQ